MLDNIKAVIFDLDGTLIDSMSMWKQIDIDYLNRFGITLPETLQTDIEGMSFSETAAYFKNTFQLDETLDEIKEAWHQMAKHKYEYDIPFKKGAKEFVKYLKNHNIKTGIATSNSKELVKAVLHNHRMECYFDSIHTACEVEKGKPAPDIYELVASELKVFPQECLVFEDVIQGIKAGKNAGMTVCAIYDDYSKDIIEAKKAEADYYIDSFYDIGFQS